jgi:hypothetical protein
MPAGLPNTVAASWAVAARPADAVPRSEVRISYTQKPAAVGAGADSMTPAAKAAPQMIWTRTGASSQWVLGRRPMHVPPDWRKRFRPFQARA